MQNNQLEQLQQELTAVKAKAFDIAMQVEAEQAKTKQYIAYLTQVARELGVVNNNNEFTHQDILDAIMHLKEQADRDPVMDAVVEHLDQAEQVSMDAEEQPHDC